MMQSQSSTQTTLTTEQTTCCIVGGGPAGAMLALLLARQGVSVVLLEAHMDFARDFRGDTIHPSVLNILEELGLVDRLLQMPHSKLRKVNLQTPQGVVTPADLSRLSGRYPYIAMIPQERFLPFIIEEAQKYSSFRLIMGAQVDQLLEKDGQVCGVHYRGHDGIHELQATLTVATDGRFSRIRKLAGFEPIKTSPPMDVLWFRVSRKPDEPELIFGRFFDQLIIVTFNRDDYWLVGYVIPKGQYQRIRAAGLDHLRHTLAQAVPELADRVAEIQQWQDISVLSVESNRLPRWYKPGLLLIGDAAHVMSPVGGVGINYAIQDAVATSNILGSKLRYGIVETRDLAKIQKRREIPTRFIQSFQTLLQQRIFAAALNPEKPFVFPPLARLLFTLPGIRNLPPMIIAYGLRPEHIKK